MNPVFDRECYGLRVLRRATLNGYDVTLLPAEAADVVAEVERLRDTVASLRASVPPTHPSDYGHEAWAETVRTAVAAERAAVVTWIRRVATDARWWGAHADVYAGVADAIENGEHRREGDE
jgi:hypothetical protein